MHQEKKIVTRGGRGGAVVADLRDRVTVRFEMARKKRLAEWRKTTTPAHPKINNSNISVVLTFFFFFFSSPSRGFGERKEERDNDGEALRPFEQRKRERGGVC